MKSSVHHLNLNFDFISILKFENTEDNLTKFKKNQPIFVWNARLSQAMAKALYK